MSQFKSPTNNVTLITNSFTGGELSKQLFGRTDLARYAVSAATLHNFIVDYRGGALSRPGSLFCGVAKSALARLIPFQYSSQISYALEFTDYAMRVVKNGAYVLNPAKVVTNVTQASPTVVTVASHGFSNGDSVYISGVNGMTNVNAQTFIVAGVTTNTFQLYTQYGTPYDTSGFPAYTSGGQAATVFTVAHPWVAADLFQLKYAQSKSVLTLTHDQYPPYELVCGGDTSWSFSPISIGSNVASPTGLAVNAYYTTISGVALYEHSYVITAVSKDGLESSAGTSVEATAPNFTNGTYTALVLNWTLDPDVAFYNIYKAIPVRGGGSGMPAGAQYGYAGMSYGNQFIDNNIIADFTKTPPLDKNPFANNYIDSVTVLTGGSGYTKNSTVTVTDSTGSGADLAAVVNGGSLSGLIVLKAGQNYSSPSLTITPGSGATYTVALGPLTGNYPAVVAYFQQRRLFASTVNRPETLWASQPGAHSDMDVRNPVLADDAYEFTLSSLKLNTIRAMVPMPGGLVIGTDSGAWQLKSGSGSSAVTAIDASADPQGYNGFADLTPIVINQDILFLQSSRTTVRNLAYNFYNNIYTGQDLTLFSSHLFLGYQIVDWAYGEDPYKVVWTVRNDGTMLSLTFIRDQEVFGWAHHQTQGLYTSVCSLQENGLNAIYTTVSRIIDGTYYTFVERFDDRNFDVIEDAWCVDCGLEYPLTYPPADAQASSYTGTITLTASVPTFSVGDIGKTVRYGGGRGLVSGYNSSTSVTVLLDRDITDVLNEDPNMTPVPQSAGSWSMTAPTTVVNGLSHLEGKSVVALADGNPVLDLTVTNGSVTLPNEATRIIVGLGYTCQLLTVPLDNGQRETYQTKRKKLSSVTIRTALTRQLQWGPDFNSLIEFQPALVPGFVYSTGTDDVADVRQSFDSGWTPWGQVAVQQSYPLPANVIAIISEVTVGDT